MGYRTNAKIEAFQEATGIKPAGGEYSRALSKLRKDMHELRDVLLLEACGVRDGNGYWQGSDVVDGILHELLQDIVAVKIARSDSRDCLRLPSNDEQYEITEGLDRLIHAVCAGATVPA